MKRGDWLEIVLNSLKDNAYADVNNLTYEKIELAKQTVEALQIGGARLDPSDMLNALMNCSFLEVPSGVDIKEMEITENHIKRKFLVSDNPKDWDRGLKEFRRRLILPPTYSNEQVGLTDTGLLPRGGPDSHTRMSLGQFDHPGFKFEVQNFW